MQKEVDPTLVSLQSDDFLSLLITNDNNYTRSVYLTESSKKEVVIIQGLEFSLLLAIPVALDPNLFYLEALRSYHSKEFGKRSLEIAREEGVSREELYRLESGNRVLKKFQMLMRESDCGAIPNQALRVKWIQANLRVPGFFSIIKEMLALFLTPSTALAEKLRGSSQWEMKFDNHQVFRHFLTVFHSVFSISHAEDVEEWDDGEGEEEEAEKKTKRHYDRVEYQILQLSGKDSNAYIHSPRSDAHDDEILKQLCQFPTPDHSYSWKFSSPPLLLSPQNTHILPVNPIQYGNKFKPVTKLDSLSTLKKLHGLTKQPPHCLKPNALDFYFSENTPLLLLDYGKNRESLLVSKQQKKVIHMVALNGGKKKVEKKEEVENLRGAKKRSFHSIKGGEGGGVIKQSTLQGFEKKVKFIQ